MALQPRTRFVWKSVLLSVGILLLGGLINVALSALRRPPEKGLTAAPRTVVTTLTAKKQSHNERLIAFGRARPITFSEVSAGVMGEVVWRSADLEPGNYVEKDVSLVRIDDRDLKAALASAEAKLAQAKVDLRKKEILRKTIGQQTQVAKEEVLATTRARTRVQSLMKGSSASHEELDNSLLEQARSRKALLELEQQQQMAQPDVDRAEAEVAAAQAAVDQSRTDLERAVVRAPFSGFIEQRDTHLGMRVAVGARLFRMVDTSRIEIQIALPASQYVHVTKGSAAKVRLTEDGPVVWEGQVSRVSPMIDETQRTFFAYLTVPTSRDRPVIPAGSFVVADIDGAYHQDVIVVPRTALLGDRLYVAVPENDPDKKSAKDQPGVASSEFNVATVEERIAGIRKMLTSVVLIDSGVQPGESVVATNVEKIAHGSQVTVTEAK